MPTYNRRCRVCDWDTDFVLEPVTDPHPPCKDCGGETERYFAGKSPYVIPDTFNTPIVDSVMTAKKQVHYTRSERKARMKDNRLQEFVKWSSGNESDKSSIHGPRWDTPPPGFIERWQEYFRERYPLTEDEKSRLVLTDKAE